MQKDINPRVEGLRRVNTLRIGDKMRQWRNGAGNAPRHYAGTRSATGRALSRTRSLTAAAVAVAMMATVAVTSLIPAYNAKADGKHLGEWLQVHSDLVYAG